MRVIIGRSSFSSNLFGTNKITKTTLLFRGFRAIGNVFCLTVTGRSSRKALSAKKKWLRGGSFKLLKKKPRRGTLAPLANKPIKKSLS